MITFTALSTSALAVFSLSGLITGRLGILDRILPFTGATVDCNTGTNSRFKYEVLIMFLRADVQ